MFSHAENFQNYFFSQEFFCVKENEASFETFDLLK